MSTPYHRGYYPPFPVINVTLYSKDARLGPFVALLDSGADATLVPTELLEQVGAADSGLALLRSHFGEAHQVQLYLVGFQVNDLLLAGLYVVGDDIGVEIILGQDVLNKLPLFLDGPQQWTEVLDDPAVKRLRSRRKQS